MSEPLTLSGIAPSPSMAYLRALIGEGESIREEIEGDPDRLMQVVREKLEGFMMPYEFGLKEILTKIEILSGEWDVTTPHNPIEHVKTRVKSMDSLLGKLVRTQCPPDLDEIRNRIRDIGGVRVTCSYVQDCYLVAHALASQPDITLLEEKDYIANVKPSGYRSLHLILEVPVFLSTRTIDVPIEVQIRTIAMDFWASAEHELKYKYQGNCLPRCAKNSSRSPRLPRASMSRWGSCAIRSRGRLFRDAQAPRTARWRVRQSA